MLTSALATAIAPIAARQALRASANSFFRCFVAIALELSRRSKRPVPVDPGVLGRGARALYGGTSDIGSRAVPFATSFRTALPVQVLFTRSCQRLSIRASLPAFDLSGLNETFGSIARRLSFTNADMVPRSDCEPLLARLTASIHQYKKN